MRGRALELRSGGDDRRGARLLLRLFDRAAAGHPPDDRRLDRGRGSGVRTSRARNSRRCSASRPRTSCSRRCAARRPPTASRDDRERRHAVLGASTVFTALEARCDRSGAGARARAEGLRGWMRTRLISFGLILAVGFLLLVSLIAVDRAARRCAATCCASLEFVVLAGVLDFAISIVLGTGLMALIYRYMPARRMHGVRLLGRARDRGAVPPRTLGDRVVPRALDAAVRLSAPPRRSRRCCCGCTTPRRSSCSARSSPRASAESRDESVGTSIC